MIGVANNPSDNTPLAIQLAYLDGRAYWTRGHLVEVPSFYEANHQLDLWGAYGDGVVAFSIYIFGEDVYTGHYNLLIRPADLKRQVVLYLQTIGSEDAERLLGALAERNPRDEPPTSHFFSKLRDEEEPGLELEHGYVDPEGAWRPARLVEDDVIADAVVSETIVEDQPTVDDINQALLAGTIGIGASGLVTSARRERVDTGEPEPEPERIPHRRALRRRITPVTPVTPVIPDQADVLDDDQISNARLRQLSISHGLDAGGYEYERVRPEWVDPLAAVGKTNVAEIEAETFGSEVMGSARDFFGENIYAMSCPVILFTSVGVYARQDSNWPETLPAGYGLVCKGILEEYDHECFACEEGADEGDICQRCEGEGTILHEGGEWALYQIVDEEEADRFENSLDTAIERLSNEFGGNVGLNADWNVMAWHLGPSSRSNEVSGDYYITEIEDDPGMFSIVQRFNMTDIDHNDRIEEIYIGDVDDVIFQAKRIISELEQNDEQSAGAGDELPATALNMRGPQRGSPDDGPRRILISYEIVTPESASVGDLAETGWENIEGEIIEGEVGNGGWTQYVSEAAEFLKDKSVEPSSSSFHQGVWYTQVDPDQNRAYFERDEERRESYHLKGFTLEEESAIYKLVTGLADRMKISYTEDGSTVEHNDRRVQLYNNGVDEVLATLSTGINSEDGEEVMFSVFSDRGALVHRGAIGVPHQIGTTSDWVLKQIIRNYIDDALISLGMNRDYLEMLGSSIPFVDF